MGRAGVPGRLGTDRRRSATALQARAGVLLDSATYRTSTTLDALNRATSMRCPQDVTGTRNVIEPLYNRAGALDRLTLNGAICVARIAYNAKGQRTLVAYGNGVMTRYAYDARTFRLVRLRSEGYGQPSANGYRPSGTVRQDLGYAFDLVGNLLTIADRTPGSGIPESLLGRDALDRTFVYEATYRLRSATGRECDRAPETPWDDSPRCTDLTRTRAYAEQYEYDDVGNVVRLRHLAGGSGFARDFALGPGNAVPEDNRLRRMTVAGVDYDYRYDPNGNMTDETDSRHLEWDHSDRMRVFRTQVGNSEPTRHVHHLFDAAGRRTLKLARMPGGFVELTVCIDGIFEHHRSIRAGVIEEDNSVHVMDNQSRVALVRTGPALTGDLTPPVKYHLADHLGSSSVVIGGGDLGADTWISTEEYSPYGETTFGGFGRKRYRFSGKERDEESGLVFFGARFYSPWTLRWLSIDPPMAATRPSVATLYCYATDNPLVFVDLAGLVPVESGVTGCDPHAGRATTPDSAQAPASPPPSAGGPSAAQPTTGAAKIETKGGLNTLTTGVPAEEAAGTTGRNGETVARKTVEVAAAATREPGKKWSAGTVQSQLRFAGKATAYGFSIASSPDSSQASGYIHLWAPNTGIGVYAIPNVGFAKTQQGDKVPVVGGQVTAAASREFDILHGNKLSIDINGYAGASTLYSPSDPSRHKIYSSELSNAATSGYSVTATAKLLDGRLSLIGELVRSQVTGNATANSDQRSTVSVGAYSGGVMVDLPISGSEFMVGAMAGEQFEHTTHPIVTSGEQINDSMSKHLFLNIAAGYMF